MAWKYPRIVVLCSGNICRSPLAEVLLKKKLGDRELDGRVISMGTLGIVGKKADLQMQRIASRMGADLSFHRSQGVSLAILSMADIIFVMDNSQRQMLASYCPRCLNKVRHLGVFLEPPRDEIADPIGCSASVFEEVAAQIDAALEAWVEGAMGE